MKKLLFPFLFLLSFTQVRSQESAVDFNFSPWSEIKAEATAQGKLIFVDCYAVWCGPCKWMDKNIFTQAEVGELMNEHFINAKIDMEKGEGIALAKEYDIRAFPTFLFLDASGNLLHRVCGARQLEEFVAEIEKSISEGSGRLNDYLEQFSNGNREAEFLAEYLVQLEGACMGYQDQLKAYWESIDAENYLSEPSWKLMNNFISDINADEFVFLLANRGQFNQKYGEEAVNNLIEKAYGSAFSSAARAENKEDFDRIAANLKNTGYENQEKIVLKAEMGWAGKRGDWQTYAEKAILFVVPYIWDNANELNSIAWKFYVNIDDYDMLMAAINWADRSVSIQRAYYNMDTYAALLLKAGHLDRGKLIAEQAIEIAQEEGQDYSGTTELLEKFK